MKKLISTILIFVLMVSVFAPTSFAYGEENSWIVNEVNRVNAEIDMMIAKAQDDVEKELAKYRLTGTGYDMVKVEKSIDRIINNLIEDTNRIAKKAIDMAASVGVEVVCEWEEVFIYNRTVLIDPLRIVGF